jgi:hypothetical protein
MFTTGCSSSRMGHGQRCAAPALVKLMVLMEKQNEKMKMIGKMMCVNVLEGFEGFTLALFTRQMGMTSDEAFTFNEKVLAELRDQRLNLWVKMVVSYGQKPLNSEQSRTDQDSAYHSGHGSLNPRSSVGSTVPSIP